MSCQMLPRKASVTIVIRSICCAKIKGQVDDFEGIKEEGEGDVKRVDKDDTTDKESVHS